MKRLLFPYKSLNDFSHFKYELKEKPVPVFFLDKIKQFWLHVRHARFHVYYSSDDYENS